jgi:hypothetical protein
VSTLKTVLLLLKYRFPDASVATPEGNGIEALTAAIPAGGATPPATVELTYGCPRANWQQASNKAAPHPRIMVDTLAR